MDKLAEAHERLNQIIKKLEQPGITIDMAENLYLEGSDIMKKMEEFKNDTSRQLPKDVEHLLADSRQKKHKLQYYYSRIFTANKRELEKKKLQDNRRILAIAIVIATSALLLMFAKIVLK